MAGSDFAFGAGVKLNSEGVITGCYHEWPIPNFLKHFKGFGDSQEDWKAAVYKWGGPKPSEIERTEIVPNGATVLVMYWLKGYEYGVQ